MDRQLKYLFPSVLLAICFTRVDFNACYRKKDQTHLIKTKEKKLFHQPNQSHYVNAASRVLSFSLSYLSIVRV